MSTFSRLTLLAQYDDMVRLVKKLIKDADEEEEATIRMLVTLKEKWDSREQAFDKEKNDMKIEINGFQKDIKKLNRQLAESRSALVRESNEKKNVARELKELMERFKQVKLLVESSESFETDAHRRRVIKCLDVDRLPAIQSDDSEDSDECVDLDYDKTEDDIMETLPRTGRRSGVARQSDGFLDILDNLPATEQPTILCRYLDKNSDDDNHHEPAEQKQLQQQQPQTRRRTTHRSATTTVTSQQIAESRLRSSSNTRAKHLLDTESESNGISSDNDIERYREQFKQEEKKRERLAATACSTPDMKGLNRAATLNAKSTASLMKINSTLHRTPTTTPSVMEPHSFITKKIFKPDNCGPCGGKITFYASVVKCRGCGVTSHPECQDNCPLPCVKIIAPLKKSCQKKQLISDYVNNSSDFKVPALIVHCCNEIERSDKIRSRGLYRVVEDIKQIEDLLLKIIRSKSGMPNLSEIDVHVLTGVVKRFLQNLDETLITTTLWGKFADATRLDSDVESLARMEYHIKHEQPVANRQTLSYLMQHFHAIAKNSDHNNMTFKDLAKALAPTLVGNSCRNPDQNTIMNERQTQLQIMETLFKFDLEFWEQIVPKVSNPTANSSQGRTTLGSRLLNNTPTSNTQRDSHNRTLTGSRLGSTLPAPRVKSLFSIVDNGKNSKR